MILVNDPPEDLSINASGEERRKLPCEVAWEGYYAFYSRRSDRGRGLLFSIVRGQERFAWSRKTVFRGYNNIRWIWKHGLLYRAYPFRSAILVSMRVLLTLLIEGAVLFLFRFRRKQSWVAFLVVNLLTQGALNVWLGQGGSLMPSYLLIGLVIGEIVVFAAEMIALPLLINEHTKRRTLLFAVAANLASLLAGGYILSVLPV